MADQHCDTVERTIVFVTAQSLYLGRGTRSVLRVARPMLWRMLAGAVEASGIPWDACHCQEMGIATVLLVPTEYPRTPLVEELTAGLAHVVSARNTAEDRVPISLRLAILTGEVTFGDDGVDPARDVVTADWMLGEKAVRAEVTGPYPVLSAVVSERVFEEVTAASPTLASLGFQEITGPSRRWLGRMWMVRLVDPSPRYLSELSDWPGVTEAVDSEPGRSGGEEVTVHTSGDDGTAVRDAAVDLLDAAGFAITDLYSPERGSWFQRLSVRRREPDAGKDLAVAVTNGLTATGIDTVVQGRDITIDIHPPDPAAAERAANAIARLIESCHGHDEVVVYMPTVLLVKIGPRVTAWEPSDDERRILYDEPRLLHSPRELLAAMHTLAHRGPTDPQPNRTGNLR